MKKVLNSILLSLILILMFSTTAFAATKIGINTKSKSLIVGDTYQLSVNSDKNKTWTSSKKSVAVVDSNGLVTGVGYGKTTITCKIGKSKYTCAVQVDDPSLSKTEIILNKKQSVTIKVNKCKSKVKWKSSDTGVASVKNGKITAKKKGIATISVSVNGHDYKCLVTVEDPTISSKKANLKVGDTFCVTIDGTSSDVSFKSSKKAVASVSSSGKITAKKNGSADIYAMVNGTKYICKVTVSKKAKTHEHSYKQSVKTVKTCTTDGECLYKCSCGSVYYEMDKAEGHNYNESIVAPTCIEKGYTTHICKACSDSYKDTYTAALGHDWSDWEVITAATETKEGTKKHTCSRCPAYETEPIPKADHVHDYIAEVTAATCTEQGYTNHTCSKCSDSYKDTYTEALGHSWSEWEVITAATETTEGTKKRTCSRCPAYETEPIPKADHEHDYVVEVTAATCTEQGYTTHTCSKCNDSYKDTYTAALGHDWSDWEVTTAATETTEGTKKRTCSRCPAYETEPIPKADHEHNYIAEVTAATCTEQGYTTHTCSKCNDSYKDTYTAALGHDWSDWEVTTAATETTEGTKKRTCSRCPAYETEPIPKADHEHDFKVFVHSPSCIDQGCTAHQCSKCFYTYYDNYTDALGHSWSDWEIIKSSSETETGLKERICSRCKKKEQEDIPKSNHVHDFSIVVTEPTCTEQGYTTHTCSKCQESYKDAYKDALGHDESDDWIVIKQSTCTEEGEKVIQCTRCKKVLDKRDIVKKAHSYKDVVVKKPTCMEDGWTDYACEVCGYKLSGWAEKASFSLHSFKDRVVEPFSCASGYTEHKCEICGYIYKTDYTSSTGDGVHYYAWNEVELPEESEADDVYYVRCYICNIKYPVRQYVIKENIEADRIMDEVIAENITDAMSDAEKILQVNIWMCENIVYDKTKDSDGNLVNGANIDRSLLGADAVTKGIAVCEGYSRIFQRFMRKLDIDCRYVVSEKLNHAWNQIKMDDGWYWVDITNSRRISLNGSTIRFGLGLLFGTGCLADDEQGGVTCNGVKWKYCAGLFEKYKITDDYSEIECYDAQKNNKYVYFYYDDEKESEKFNPFSNEYKSKYSEGISSSLTVFGDGKVVHIICNNDNIKELMTEWKERKENPVEPVDPIDETYSAYEVKTGDDTTTTIYGKYLDTEASSFLSKERAGLAKKMQIFGFTEDSSLTAIAKERALQCAVKFGHSVSWSEEAASSYYKYNYEMIDMGDITSDTLDVAALWDNIYKSSEHRDELSQMDEGLIGTSIFETKIDGQKKYILVQIFKEYE